MEEKEGKKGKVEMGTGKEKGRGETLCNTNFD